MASTAFDARFATANRAEILDRFGVAVTYTPPGGAGTAATAARYLEGGSEGHRRRRYAVSEAVIASPVLGATITDAGEVWVVQEVADEVGGLRLLSCERAREHSHAGR